VDATLDPHANDNLNYTGPIAFSIGVIHGLGAETPSQPAPILLAANLGGIARGAGGMWMFLTGLLVMNTLMTASACGLFHRAAPHPRMMRFWDPPDISRRSRNVLHATAFHRSAALSYTANSPSTKRRTTSGLIPLWKRPHQDANLINRGQRDEGMHELSCVRMHQQSALVHRVRTGGSRVLSGAECTRISITPASGFSCGNPTDAKHTINVRRIILRILGHLPD